MSTKKILFSTDFSELSDAGLTFATSLARDMDGELIIVHALEEPAIYAGEFYYGNAEPDPNAVRTMLHAVNPKTIAFPTVIKCCEVTPPTRSANSQRKRMSISSLSARTDVPDLAAC